ncbi:MAG: hypothetical protein MJ180_01200 [Candidatus Gastranaerophilales bacterium]|nr:hypothetical protein [Candidatus Gastranaerophilales bacterium]
MNIEAVSSVGKILKKITARCFIKAKNIINPFASTTCDTVELSAQRSVKKLKNITSRPIRQGC